MIDDIPRSEPTIVDPDLGRSSVLDLYNVGGGSIIVTGKAYTEIRAVAVAAAFAEIISPWCFFVSMIHFVNFQNNASFFLNGGIFTHRFGRVMHGHVLH
jgi:hypothetical protein